MRTLAVIPARANSKGLPGKNVREFKGKPLIQWSIEIAKACSMIDEVCVSSDGANILSVADRNQAISVQRPADLATDTALPKDAVLHALDTIKQRNGLEFDIVVLLQPTSPLRAESDITACLNKIVDEGYDSSATFCGMSPHPERAWRIENDRPAPYYGDDSNWAPRQSLGRAFALNGAVYAVRVDAFRKSGSPAFLFGNSAAIEMPPERSFDIDTLLDFQVAEFVSSVTD